MKHFKKLSFTLLLCIVTLAFSSDASAAVRKQNRNGGDNGAVGAPLDGGLLSVLGAAGVGYYLMRKKKRNSPEI